MRFLSSDTNTPYEVSVERWIILSAGIAIRNIRPIQTGMPTPQSTGSGTLQRHDLVSFQSSRSTPHPPRDNEERAPRGSKAVHAACDVVELPRSCGVAESKTYDRGQGSTLPPPNGLSGVTHATRNDPSLVHLPKDRDGRHKAESVTADKGPAVISFADVCRNVLEFRSTPVGFRFVSSSCMAVK